jgi:UDP-N-acetylglucosamine acyltransferase
MNFEGLRRRGFTPERISGVKAMHKALYRQELTLQAAQTEISQIAVDQPACQDDVRMMLDFLQQTNAQRGIVR